MRTSKMMNLVNEAIRDIATSEAQIGNANQKDNALIFAQIAQTKLLVVIAQASIELCRNARARWEEDDTPYLPMDRQG